MSWYPFVVALHVLTAVLGIGPVAALALAAPSGGSLAPDTARQLRRLATVAQPSLGVMLLTGIVLVAATRGAFASAWWLRISVLLFLVLGAAIGRLRSVLGKAEAGAAPASVRGSAWVIAGLVAAIVVLMVAKPV